MNALSKNPTVAIKPLENSGFCDIELPLPTGSSRPSELKKVFTLNVANAVFKYCLDGPTLTRIIGEGSFGRVFVDKKDNVAVKMQVFKTRNAKEFKDEIELNKLFGMNKIAPKLLGHSIFKTSLPSFGGGIIAMEKHDPLDNVLKSASAERKKTIMKNIEPQMISILNKMLSLGYACIDLKPNNSLLGAGDKLYMIDFTADLCEEAPVLIKLAKQNVTKSGVVTFKSLLPTLLRKDIIAAQLVFFHATTKLFTRSYFATDLIERMVFSPDQPPIRNSYKMLLLGKVPRIYENFLNDKKSNQQLRRFLRRFSEIGSLNFRHYTKLDKTDSYEKYISFLVGKISE